MVQGSLAVQGGVTVVQEGVTVVQEGVTAVQEECTRGGCTGGDRARGVLPCTTLGSLVYPAVFLHTWS